MTSSPRDAARLVVRRAACAIAVLSLLAGVGGHAAGANTVARPTAPTSVGLAPSTPATTLRATWQNAGPAVDLFAVQVLDSSGFVGQVLCLSATCTSQRLPGLTPGGRYRVEVYAMNAAGWSRAGTSAWVTVGSGCSSPTGMCVAVDARAADGSAAQRGQGFLHALRVPLTATQQAALRPTAWRVRAADWHTDDFDNARATGAEITVIVSDMWLSLFTSRGQQPVAPWRDWARYRAWVTDYARSLVASGRNPDYWEIQNEPGHNVNDMYSVADMAGWTQDRMLEQFRIAYEAIKAVDPDARIIGPSLAWFADSPSSLRPDLPDIRTFLAFAEQHGLRPAAIAWHEIQHGTYMSSRYFSVTPGEIATRVDAVRALIGQYDVGNPEIFINEYSNPITAASAGWAAGYLSAFEAADVAQANRSCWPAASIAPDNTCDFALNGLFTDRRNLSPTGVYWVHRFYAGMVGTRVAAQTSTVRLSAFATRGGDGSVQVLLGRHEECTMRVPGRCAGRILSRPAPADVPVAVKVPGTATTWRAVVRRIPDGSGPLAQPVAVADRQLNAVSGSLVVTVPRFADGESFTITLTPVA